MVEESKRYAKALFDVGLKRNATCDYKDKLCNLRELCSNEKELWPFLLNYSISKNDRKNVISKILEDDNEGIFLNFVKLLIDKDCIKFLSSIEKSYNKLYNDYHNIIELRVTSALELDEAEIQAIKRKYKEKFCDFDIDVINVVDKSIIGGIRIEYKDRVIDATLRTKLMNLKEHMLAGEQKYEK
ncbi:MAG: ATP synthase F1 subunit delta [Clostridiales bacterium]|nr:ATP synthase F1 subunit delta [Clostridiales bacterium]